MTTTTSKTKTAATPIGSYGGGSSGLPATNVYANGTTSPVTPTSLANAAKTSGAYTGTTNQNNISGSASVGINKATTDALKTANTAITGNKGGTALAPDDPSNKFNTATGQPNPNYKDPNGSSVTNNKTVSSQSVDSNTGATTYKYSDGTSEVKQADPATASLYADKSAALTQADAQYQASLSQSRQSSDAQVAQYEKEKADALAAAETSYAQNNPEGSGSDKAQFLASVSSKYDSVIASVKQGFANTKTNLELQKQSDISNVNSQFQSNLANIPTQQLQQQQIKANMLNTSIDNFQKTITNNPDLATLFNSKGEVTGSYDKVQSFIQTAKGMGVPEELILPMLKTEVANAKAKQATVEQAAAKAELDEKRVALSEASASRSEAMLGLALNRDVRADQTAARTQVKAIEQDFLKTNTASQSLSVGQQYLARIEAASGEGVSALGLIDALVKLDTGGQAVRQGQTDILTESGTWGDSWNRIKAKMGFSSKVGANTILTKNQVEQIKTQAKKIAKEQIAAAVPAFVSAKEGINAIKQDYPNEASQIDAYSSQLKSAETFIKKYGSAEDKKQAGIEGSSDTNNSNASSDNPLGI